MGPVLDGPVPELFLLLGFGADKVLYLLMYDFAGALFRGLGDSPLGIATEEILAQPIGNGHSRQPGEFAQGVGALDQRDLRIAAR